MNEVTNSDRLAAGPEPFTLPPKRNRRVSPYRYSLEHVPQNSRYPMKKTREGVTDKENGKNNFGRERELVSFYKNKTKFLYRESW